jgi:nucleoside-diphosphate-sugar epimerase
VIVLVAGADGRLGRLLVELLGARGHTVRGLVRTEEHAPALEELGAKPVVADLRGDVEWAVAGCEAAIFAAGARSRADFGAIDGGGAAKLAEAADRFELRRFVLCSALGADSPDGRSELLHDFLAAKRFAEHRLQRLDLPWTILRFGGLTSAPGTGRITTTVDGATPRTISRADAALTVVEALARPHLARHLVEVAEGDRHIADALDAVEPAALPPLRPSGLATGQAVGAPSDPDMLLPDAAPLDTAVDYEGEGPAPPEILGNDDPSPNVP